MGCILNAAFAASRDEEFFAGNLYFHSTRTLKNKNCFVNMCISPYIRSKFHSEPLPTKSLTSSMPSQENKAARNISAQITPSLKRSAAHEQ